jgi:hypothetical protein
VTLPKPQTSGAKAEGRFGKQDFVDVPAEDVYRCPAGAKLKYHFTVEETVMELDKRVRVYHVDPRFSEVLLQRMVRAVRAERQC